MANNEEVSFTDSNAEITESKLMKDVEHQSTPIQSKKSDDNYEMFKMIQTMLEMDRISMLNKFSEQKSEFNELNKRFDSNDNRFDELKNDINEINRRCKNTHETIKNSLSKLEQSVERMEVVVMNPKKNKTNENCSDKCKNMIPDKELTNNNNNVEHNECNIENNNVFKELVLSLIHI